MVEFVRGNLAAVGRTAMGHPDHDLRITLYPMFHIGSPAFYDALSEDLQRFRVFLLEGVRRLRPTCALGCHLQGEVRAEATSRRDSLESADQEQA
jgi:hypothetical protein